MPRVKGKDSCTRKSGSGRTKDGTAASSKCSRQMRSGRRYALAAILQQISSDHAVGRRIAACHRSQPAGVMPSIAMKGK